VHHPPDEKQRYDPKDDVDEPVARSLRFAKVEHARIVARALRKPTFQLVISIGKV
jgi:hypothetical protein